MKTRNFCLIVEFHVYFNLLKLHLFAIGTSEKKNMKKNHLKEAINLICTECGKTFRREATLRTHMQVHKEESYQCSLCDKVYDSAYKMKEHRRKIHRPKVNCPICQKEFAQKQNVKKHVASAHNN